ncbi:MAG TPA: Obg family GTPase CgtA, partial [Elusimicrobiota bacterium]|nr:Obg family GTPase CgtA [Elusimicrobiota bacterium]
QDGGNGGSSSRSGADAEDMVVSVPVGTVVYRGDRPLADLSKAGDQVVIAKGGRGGRGNQSFKNQRNPSPQIYEKGQPGERVELDLELKLIADVGLVGFPNAGKSTILARVSNARPKIAAYPFTTLAPHLGIVQHKNATFVLADIPGLIEGAHEGKGLGADFLRHVERTRYLVHLVDPAGFGGVSAADGVKKIEEELAGYSQRLASKPRALAVNKMDLPEGAVALKAVRARYRRRKIFAISGATGEGIRELLDFVLAELARIPKDDGALGPEPGEAVVRVEQGFRIRRIEENIYQVWGSYVERVAAMSDMTLPESVARLQAAFKKIGLDKALKNAGVQDGDFVRIGGLELEWGETAAPSDQLVARRPEVNAARKLRGRRPRSPRKLRQRPIE